MALTEQAPNHDAGTGGVEAALAPEPLLTSVGAAELADFGGAEVWATLASAPSTESFAAAWLDLQCRLIGGVRAAVVVFGPRGDGTFAPLASWPPGHGGTPALAAVAELALAERRGAVRYRQVGPAPGSEHLVDAVSYPLLIGTDLRGAAALEVLHGDDARLRGVMRLLQWGCAWWDRHLAGAAKKPGELTTVLELTASGLQEEGFLGAATAVVTELATRLRCERVAYGVRQGRHARVRALSHTATFNRKSALIRALGVAMDEAIDQQETLRLPSPQQVPLVLRAQQLLLDGHATRAVCTVPVADAGRLVGALTLERADERPFSNEEVRLCEHLAVLIGPVLEAKRREDRWIGVKVWDALWDGLGRLFGPRHLVLKIATLALAGLVVFFSLASGYYRVTAPAALEGTVQRAITAPQDGYIASAAVRAGDLVELNQSLAALEDKDLRLEKVKWEGEREKFLREYSKALAEGDRARVRILGAQVEQAEARIALLVEQLARTRITAPFTGVVVSGDLTQSLGAPVSRGEVLFEIAPLDSYRVILQVDERDITQIQVGQSGALALSGLPGELLTVRIDKITPVADAEGGNNLFRVEAALDQLSPALRPGMKGVAKIDVDERNLFWIWTHRLAYWLRLWWWTWWP